MFIKNFNLQNRTRHHELFLPTRPYRGEPPTVAGFLLYPDTPTKMETTSREAFCFKPQQDRDKGGLRDTVQESHHSHPTGVIQTGGTSSKDREQGDDKQKGNHVQTPLIAAKNKQEAIEMQSQYQTDFPPPSTRHRRRTPAFPQPDNIGINPAFRFEFSTVQRKAYPGWHINNHRCTSSLRVVSSAQQNF